jgi:hypothetical protein
MLVRNTLKYPKFVNGIGRIREFDLFVGGPEQNNPTVGKTSYSLIKRDLLTKKH